jgi:hypothetical protein
MSITTPHGANGCPCEDCLAARINTSAEAATRDRTIVPLWARQRRFRVRPAQAEMLRRSPLTA